MEKSPNESIQETLENSLHSYTPTPSEDEIVEEGLFEVEGEGY